MRFAVTAFAAVFVLALTPSGLAAGEQSERVFESSFVRQINVLRREHGLKPLTISTKLAAAAAQHTREMGADGYFEHESYDNSPFWKRIAKWYPSRGWSTWEVGENIVWSSPNLTPNGAIAIWLESPEHRANMLGKTWREIGVSAIHFNSAPGAYGGAPVTIVTADFGSRR